MNKRHGPLLVLDRYSPLRRGLFPNYFGHTCYLMTMVNWNWAGYLAGWFGSYCQLKASYCSHALDGWTLLSMWNCEFFIFSTRSANYIRVSKTIHTSTAFCAAV